MRAADNSKNLFESLQADLKELDLDRKKIKRRLIIEVLLEAPILIFLIVYLIQYGIDEHSIGIPFWGIAIASSLFSFRVFSIKYPFENSYKERIIKKVIKAVDSEFSYKPKTVTQKLGDNEKMSNHLSRLGMFSFRTIYMSDTIEGKTERYNFVLSKVHLRNSVGAEGGSTFVGIVIVMVFDKPFPTDILMIPRASHKLLASGWGPEVKLEHKPAMNAFKVFAENPTACLEVLHQKFLDGLVNMHSRVSTGKHSVRLAFVNKTITIAVDQKKDFFEARIFKPINDRVYFESNIKLLTLYLGLPEEIDEILEPPER
jgi:hypothetical protein